MDNIPVVYMHTKLSMVPLCGGGLSNRFVCPSAKIIYHCKNMNPAWLPQFQFKGHLI